ncbi:hypothetical protein [Nostoc sp.]|uniref:hypothetical protein n=1 Tax=Nostoc sp. TaxID=1180 RepID=UPI002FF73BE8
MQKVADERRDRLQNGLREGNFYVYFCKGNLTIQIKHNDVYFLEIDLETCNNSRELLDWIFHIHGKALAGSSCVLDLILTVLDDACYDVHGKGAETLFIRSEALNWRNP